MIALLLLLVLAATTARAELYYAASPEPPQAVQAAPAPPPAPEARIEDVVRLRAALEAGDDHRACQIARRLFAIAARKVRSAKVSPQGN